MSQLHAALVQSARFQHYLEGLPAAFSVAESRPLWRDASGRVQGQFFQCALTSEFIPIVNPGTGNTFAHEGRIRTYASDGAGLSAWRVFARAADDASLVALDRMCRLVHAVNYFQGDDTVPLIVSIHDRLLAAVMEDHGASYRNVLIALGLPQDYVWIQVPATANSDMALLLQAVRNYRRNGFHIVLQAEDLAEAETLLRNARPAMLSIDLRRSWSVEQLHALRARCTDEAVLLMARHVETPVALARIEAADIGLMQGRGVAQPASVTHPENPVLAAANWR